MRIRRRIAALLAAGLTACAGASLPVLADDTAPTTGGTTAAQPEASADDRKTFRIVEENGRGSILQEPEDTAAFWEYPLLPAGQERSGRLCLVNDGPRVVAVTMTPDLPYGDEAAMLYLAGLHVAIRQAADGTTLYDGPYTGLADRVPLLSIPELKPGEEREYIVTVRCSFRYEGDPLQDSSEVSWLFRASAEIVTTPEDDGGPAELTAKILLAAALLLAAAGAALVIVRLVKRRKRRAQ